MTMNKDELKVTYYGPAVDKGEMDIAILGSALSGLAEFLEVSRRVIDDRSEPTSIRLSSISKKNSIELQFVIEIIQQAPEIISPAIDIAELGWDSVSDWWEEYRHVGRYLFRTIRGIVDIVKQHPYGTLRRVPTTDERLGRPHMIAYETANEPARVEPIVRSDIAVVFESRKTRPKLLKFFKPVEHDGINGVLLESGQEQVHVTKRIVRRYRYLRLPKREEYRTEETLTVMAPYFYPGRKWKLKGRKRKRSVVFAAEIRDRHFMNRVMNREIQFRHLDRMEVTLVTLRSVQVAPGKPRDEEHYVEVVHRYIEGTAHRLSPFEE